MYSSMKWQSSTMLNHNYFCIYLINRCVDHNKLENSERDGNTRPPDLPLEKPVCRSGSIVRTGHATTDWFQIGKAVRQGYVLSPCFLTYIQNTS